jgi:hypothetical protein
LYHIFGGPFTTVENWAEKLSKVNGPLKIKLFFMIFSYRAAERNWDIKNKKFSLLSSVRPTHVPVFYLSSCRRRPPPRAAAAARGPAARRLLSSAIQVGLSCSRRPLSHIGQVGPPCHRCPILRAGCSPPPVRLAATPLISRVAASLLAHRR